MKKKFILFLLMISFIGIGIVRALPTSLTNIKQVGERVRDNACTSPTGSCYSMGLKIDANTNYALLCTEYNKTTPAESGTTCNITNEWNESVRYAIGKIIVNAKSGINTTGLTPNYFSAEMAINSFLNEKGLNSSHIYNNFSSTYKSLYESYLNTANNAYNSFSNDSSVNITLSSNTLTFTFTGDKYVSNSITVSGVDSYTVTTTKGKVEKNNNSFYVEIPKTSISAGNNSVEVTVSASKQLPQARKYDCGSEYQPVTISDVEYKSYSGSKKLSGTITTPKVVIKKYGEDDKTLLSGVKLKVIDKNGNDVSINGTLLEWVTDDKEHEIVGLPEGTYYLIELETIDGYDLNKEKVEFVVDYEIERPISVIMKNKLTEVEISKVNAVDGKELPGATLQILDSDGKPLEICLDKDGNEIKECKWVSTDEPFIVKGLKAGKYQLKELIAPKGYILKETVVDFEVKADGEITKVEMKNELEVEVPDTLSSKSALLLAIAMFDIALGIGIVSYVQKNKIEE